MNTVPHDHNPTALDRFCWFMTRHRLPVLISCLLLALILGYGAFSIRGEVILQDLFPYDHPYLKLHARFSEVFGSGGSGVAIALRAKQGDIFNQNMLTKLHAMTAEVELWEEVYRFLTVSIASRSVKVVKARGKGEIVIEPLMWPKLPSNPEEMELLKKRIFSDPTYNGTLVAGDGTAALLLTEFKENISYARVFLLLRQLAEKYTDDQTSVHYVGFPALMGWIYSYTPQIILVFALSIGFMVLILYLIFRNLTGMVAPLAFGILCTGMGIGFIGWTGINFSPLLYVLAFLVVARMVSHSVQITCRYFEEYEVSSGDNIQACYQTMRAMNVPNWAGITTDAAGFLVLLFAKIALMQQVAILMSFWMMTIGLCSIVTPILCSYMPLGRASEKWRREQIKKDWLDVVCIGMARFSIGGGKYPVALLCGAALLFCLWQTSGLQIGDPTPGSPLLWPDHPYNQDQALINTTFNASSENFMLFFEGKKESVYDPVVLATFEAFARHMQKELPDLYKSYSALINTVKMINLNFHDGDKLWYQLPRDEQVLTGLMGWVRQNTDKGSLSRFLDSTLERAQITIYFSDHISENLLRIRDAAQNFFQHHPMQTGNGEFKLAGGRIGMEIAVNEEMKRSHLIIDSMVLAAIFVLCSFFFRSVVAGLMLTLPLILANLVAFTYMAAMDIGLSINTLPVAAVGVGVGVDFAIYIYSRCIEEFRGDYASAIIEAVGTSGEAVAYTGLIMILPILSWYFISDLKFQAQMGFFLAAVMMTNVLLSITLHPLMLHVLKPRFIRRASPAGPDGTTSG